MISEENKIKPLNTNSNKAFNDIIKMRFTPWQWVDGEWIKLPINSSEMEN